MNSKKIKRTGGACALIAGMLAPMALPAADVAVAFSPGIGSQSAEQLVLNSISSARHSIHIAAHSFTSKNLAEALINATRRGVVVKAVLNPPNGAAENTGAALLTTAHIPVRIDARYAVMHDKFMVIDGTDVQTGSFSYTAAAAQNNAENVILLRGVAGVARDYDAEWARLWNEATSL